MKGLNKISLEPSLLQANQPQLSQPVLIGEVFHLSDHFCGPNLDPLNRFDRTELLKASYVSKGSGDLEEKGFSMSTYNH